MPFAASLLGLSSAAIAQPVFTGKAPLSSDTGQASLAWQADGPVAIVISDSNGKTRPLFGGSGEQLFLSGLGDGNYTVNIAPENGEVSDSIVLTVRHQSLARALLLTLLGGVVFLIVLAVIVRGSRDG